MWSTDVITLTTACCRLSPEVPHGPEKKWAAQVSGSTEYSIQKKTEQMKTTLFTCPPPPDHRK